MIPVSVDGDLDGRPGAGVAARPDPRARGPPRSVVVSEDKEQAVHRVLRGLPPALRVRRPLVFASLILRNATVACSIAMGRWMSTYRGCGRSSDMKKVR